MRLGVVVGHEADHADVTSRRPRVVDLLAVVRGTGSRIHVLERTRMTSTACLNVLMVYPCTSASIRTYISSSHALTHRAIGVSSAQQDYGSSPLTFAWVLRRFPGTKLAAALGWSRTTRLSQRRP
jgi:hypothetical protein